MTYQEFIAYATEYYHTNKNNQRYGQALFNALYAANPILGARVRSSPVDPFYNDKRAPAFWEFIEENWNEFA